MRGSVRYNRKLKGVNSTALLVLVVGELTVLLPTTTLNLEQGVTLVVVVELERYWP